MVRNACDDTLKVGGHLLCLIVLATAAGCGGSDGGSGVPAINGTPMSQVEVGQTYSFTPIVSGSGQGAVSFSIQNKPSWASEGVQFFV